MRQTINSKTIGLLLGCCLLNTLSVSGVTSDYFRVFNAHNIPSVYEQFATFYTIKVKYFCAGLCARDQYCVYFLYNKSLSSCLLLGFNINAPTTVTLADYYSWDAYVLATSQDCAESQRTYIRQFAKCIRVDQTYFLSWTNSLSICNDEGGYLLNINSLEEFEFFRAFFSKIVGDPSHYFHVGLKMKPVNTGLFRWLTDVGTGSEINPKFWSLDQPDFNYPEQWCTTSRAEDEFYLNNVSCDWYQGHFVCEYSS